MKENEIGKVVVDRAVRLHMELGPGLLETVYEVILADMLQESGLRVVRQGRRKAHKKQVLTYLKLTGKKLGYMLNFGDELMKDGISRILNGHVE
ncbi:MAG: GxxExxY protein [Deltaproteobacteria bacterium]|nr:GxxExxY protein [Deltaproteobacteria bacterium]